LPGKILTEVSLDDMFSKITPADKPLRKYPYTKPKLSWRRRMTLLSQTLFSEKGIAVSLVVDVSRTTNISVRIATRSYPLFKNKGG